MQPNHGGEPPRSIWGPIGSHWVQKMGQNRKQLPCPKIRIFDNPAAIDFSQKNRSRGDSANSRWKPLGSILGPRVPLGKKTGQNLKKLPCPKIRIFDYPGVIHCSKKKITVMAPNHGGDPLGSILGPMGSHWVKKMGQIVKITMPQDSNFRLPRGHRFF